MPFRVFLGKNLKKYCHIWNQHLWISVIAKFFEETKMPKFGSKNTLFRYFSPRMPYLDIFREELKKKYCHIWNHHPQTCLFAKFCENAWFGYSWAGIWKQFCHIWNQQPRICLIAKFCRKTKMPKFGSKNALFWYFWPKMLYLGVFRLGFKKGIVRFEISTLKFVEMNI